MTLNPRMTFGKSGSLPSLPNARNLPKGGCDRAASNKVSKRHRITIQERTKTEGKAN